MRWPWRREPSRLDLLIERGLERAMAEDEARARERDAA